MKHKQISKKILALFLSLVCVVGLLPTTALAADPDDAILAQAPATITMTQYIYNAITYTTPELGTVYFHQIYADVNGDNIMVYCNDHSKDLGYTLNGRKWAKDKVIHNDVAQMMLNYYYTVESQGEDDTWDDLTKQEVNAWVQAVVWRAQREGYTFATKTLDEIKTMIAEERMSSYNAFNKKYGYPQITSIDDGSSWTCLIHAQHIISRWNGDYDPLTHKVIIQYTYADKSPIKSADGTRTFYSYTIQPLLILVPSIDDPTTLEPGIIKIKKVDIDDPTKPVQGAEFLVNDVTDGVAIRQLPTGSDGTVIFKNLKTGHEYKVTEVKAGDGYEISDTTEYPKERTVTLTDAAPEVTLEFRDKSTGQPALAVFDFNIPGAAADLHWEPDGALKVGDKIVAPTASTQTFGNATFTPLGWYTEPEGGTKVADNGGTVTVVAGKTIYYQQWDVSIGGGGGTTPVATGLYNVYWDYNYEGGRALSALHGSSTSPLEFVYSVIGSVYDGYGSTTSTTKTANVTIKIGWSYPEKPTRLGYDFMGWATSATATSGTSTPADPGKSDTFYAIWRAKTYTQTWNSNGGDTANTTTNAAQDSLLYSAMPAEPTRVGYTFSGWYCDAACTMPIESDMPVKGAGTWYAGWEGEPVYVYYYDNREGTGLIATEQYRYGDAFIPRNDMQSTAGQTFIWWSADGTLSAAGIRYLTQSSGLVKRAAGSTQGVVSATDYWTLDLYALWQENTTDYTVTVNYDDYLDNDGCRPTSIEIGLVSSNYNDSILKRQTLTVDNTKNSQQVTFTNLPITTSSASVEKITYRAIVYGYTDVMGNHYDVNETLETTGNLLVATKKMAPSLMALAGPYTQYAYTINNAVVAETTTAQYASTITLSHAYILTDDDVKFNIQWEDDNDNDGTRPNAVLLVLYADGVEVDREMVNAGMCDVSADGNSWTYIWRDMQKYDAGAEVKYTTAVMNNAGTATFNNSDNVTTANQLYITSYVSGTTALTGDAAGAVIRKANELCNQTVTIRWNDESNRDNVRPEAVTVSLYAYQWNAGTQAWENRFVRSANVTGIPGTDEWSYTYNSLPVYNDGEAISYYAVISSDLNAQVSGNQYSSVTNEMAITVSRQKDTKNVLATIEWADEMNSDGTRPQSVLAELYADGVKVSGAKYTAIISGSSKSPVWTYTFENLPVYKTGAAGVEIVYQVKVSEVEAGSLNEYEQFFKTSTGAAATAIADSAYSYALLAHERVVANQTVTITWDDESNRDNVRPGTVEVSLYAYQWNAQLGTWEHRFVDSAAIVGDVTLDSWQHTFANMPTYNNGYKITYYAQITSNLNAQVTGNTYSTVTNKLNITASRLKDTRDVIAQVEWADARNTDKVRPNAVILDLYADGVKVPGAEYTVTLSGDSRADNWYYTFGNLPVYQQGKEGTPIVYSIRVAEVTPGSVYATGFYTANYLDASETYVTAAAQSAYTYVKLLHDAVLADKKVTITWDDESNRDKVRPASVEISLYAYQWNDQLGTWEDKFVKSVNLTGNVSDDTWEYTFPDMPVYNAGSKITYYAKITSDLNAQNTGNAYSTVTNELSITASRKKDTRDVIAQVEWADAQNTDAVRPSAVILDLYADGVKVPGADYTVTLSGDATADNWYYTFGSLPVYRAGEEGTPIVYSIRVAEVLPDSVYGTDRYTVKYLNAAEAYIDAAADSAYPYVKLLHRALLSDQVVTITWDDESNRDNVRPSAVVISLYADQWNAELGTWESKFIKSVSLAGSVMADTWSYTFADMPTYHDGSKITYYAKITSDLNAQVTGNPYSTVTNELNITVSRKKDTRDVTAQIEWADAKNTDAVRPTTVILDLYADGVKVNGADYTVTLADDARADNWYYTFSNLPVYRAGAEGVPIVYSVRVAEVTPGSVYGTTKYSAKYMNASENYTETAAASAYPYVMLLHKALLADQTVTITWDDESNRDDVRPDTIEISLYAYQWNPATYAWEHKFVDSAEIHGDVTLDTWHYTFPQKPVYSGSVEVVYYAQISSDLNAQVTGNKYSSETNKLDITVSRQKDAQNIVATVEWADKNNNDSIRPDAIELKLYTTDGVTATPVEGVDYTVVLSGDKTADTWTYTFENVPVYEKNKEGVELVYIVQANELKANSLYGYYISTANGQEQEVLRYAATYPTNAGNTSSVLAQSKQPVVILTHGAEDCTVYLYVTWDDVNNTDGLRPESVVATLYKTVDGQTFSRINDYTISAANMWTQKVADLPAFEDGKKVTYVAELKSNVPTGYGDVVVDGLNIHISHAVETGSVSAQINWADNDNNDGHRPDAVLATLYANGVATGDKLELNANNGWTVTWNNLTANCIKNGVAGTPIIYTVSVAEPEGYVATYTPTETTTANPQTISVLLTDAADVVTVDATIVWQDQSNHDSARPASVKVQLYADGEKVAGKFLDITGTGDTWTAQFTNIPKYADGKEINYSIGSADNVGVTYKILPAGMTLYLGRAITTRNLVVNVKFNDANDADGQRPTTYYLHLLVNGVRVDDADYIIVGDEAEKTYTFKELPVYVNGVTGDKIKYGVEAEFDAEYGSTSYTSKVTQNNSVELGLNNTTTLTLTLSRQVDTATQTGHIYWFDANNQRGNRPDTLVINLQSDATGNISTYTVNSKTGKVTDKAGKAVGTVTVAEWSNDGSSVWTYTIEGLVKNAVYSNGSKPIYYYTTAQATGISNYYTSIVDGEENGMNIGLTHKDYMTDVGSSAKDFTVKVLWQDNDDAWGYRPDTLGSTVTLYANGIEKQQVKLTRSNADEGNDNLWTYTFTGLPTYLNGSAVVWTAGIAGSDKYTVSASNTAEEAVLTMTQSMGINFTAKWEDSDNDDAVRPANLTVALYADGSYVESITLTETGKNTYTGDISDLPVWRTTGNKAISYSFHWLDSSFTALHDNDYTATATQFGTAVESNEFYWISAKTWGDNTDAGYNDLTGTYEWETTLKRDKEKTTVYASVIFDDDGNRDGLRPDNLNIQLYADGVAVGEPTEITGASTDSAWNQQWEKKDVYKAGVAVTYTMQVVGSTNGYAIAYDATGLTATMTHLPEKKDVTATINWLDGSEVHYDYNSLGDLIKAWYGIERVDVYAQLYADGTAIGAPVLIPASGYLDGAGNRAIFANYKWAEQYVFENEGETVDYTIQVYSNDLDALFATGYTMAYDFSDNYAPSATIEHTYYNVSGDVYYLYNTSADFLKAGIPVTAYLYDEQADSYTAVGSAVTDANGHYEIRNLPQGLLVVRAVYQKDNYTYAGSKGVNLSKCSTTAEIIINRDASSDSALYTYTAKGTAYYQTDASNPATKHIVPEGSIVLLYEVTPGSLDGKYLTMTTTDAFGSYTFTDLSDGQYFVNVVFPFDGGTYTYDNDNALADGISFLITGADVTWRDIVKQVNETVTPGNVIDDPTVPVIDDPKPLPCVVSGNVFYSDNGIHTTEPVENVDAYIYTAADNILVAQTKTDADGKWEVEGISVGKYIAVFSYSGNASRVLRFTVTEGTFAAGTFKADAQYFERVASIATATISGVVLDENGRQIPALVKVLDTNGNLVNFCYAADNGAYFFTVAAGQTYRVVIDEISKHTTKEFAGDPDDALTTLNYYVISGNFSINGLAQANSTVALYSVNADGTEGELTTATITNDSGDYSLKVTTGGNYRVVYFKDALRYGSDYVTVGYQEYEPVVTGNVADGYTITGSEPAGITSGKLYNTTEAVVTDAGTVSAGSSYAFSGMTAGTYRLELLLANGTAKTYYIDAPADSITRVTYYMTIGGTAIDGNGNIALGSVVRLLDSTGAQVGNSQTILADGKYGWTNIAEGEYAVEIAFPVNGDRLADRSTTQPDSFGSSYANGMTPDSTWVYNLNATSVSGTVKDQTGSGIADAIVLLSLNGDPNKAYATKSDANGNWTAGVKPGTYVVSASYALNPNHVYNCNDTEVVIVGSENIDGTEIVINRYILTGTVSRIGDGKKVNAADISVLTTDGEVVATTTTDANGAFSVILYTDDYEIKAEADATSDSADVFMDENKAVTLELALKTYITGKVFRADGTAASDATVYYTGKTSGSVYTNNAGEYSIALNANDYGTYTLYASANGADTASVTITVQTDAERNFTLPQPPEQTVAITGIVTDNEGHRLKDTTVTLVYGNDKTKTLTTSSDDNGNYTFYVPAGTYYLSAEFRQNGYTYKTNGETMVSVETENITKNIAIKLSYDVLVKVVDTMGSKVANAVVSYTGAATGSATVNADGEAVLSIAGGSVSFIATIGNRTSQTVTSSIESNCTVTITVPVVGVATEEPKVESTNFTLTGKVVDPTGNVISGVTVKLLKFNIVTEIWEQCSTATSDANGRYEFNDLDAGRYRVDYSYELQTPNVPSKDGGYAIKGYAEDGAGNPYTYATVILLNQYGAEEHRVTAGTDGYYEFLDLRNETYTVKIVPAGAGENQPASVTPTPAQPESQTISGIVVDANGKPVEGATVVVTDGTSFWSSESEENGYYCVEVPTAGKYTVSITYPVDEKVVTDTHENDPTDKIKPELTADDYTVSGYVHDSDGNVVAGAMVKLKKNGVDVASTTTDANGYYAFTDLAPGEYEVSVTIPTGSKSYDVNTETGVVVPGENEDPVTMMFHVNGTVVTDHHTRLVGADVTLKNLDTGVVYHLTTDSSAAYASQNMPTGRYEISAIYTDAVHGASASDAIVLTSARDDLELVIVLKYTGDVNGDGHDETVYAGQDDTFDTADDFYDANVDGQGSKERVYAKADGLPGTADDEYKLNGKAVNVGTDRIPGTTDDNYKADTDNDGVKETIYAGADGIPFTADDFYYVDANGDGTDDMVFTGPDTIPGTPDDYYSNTDPDNDGSNENVYAGPDGIIGTEDDYYINDDGEHASLNTIYVRFNANNGTVNGKAILTKVKGSFTTLPTAVRDGYTFDGWYPSSYDGTKIDMSVIDAITKTTTYYAHWTNNNPGGGGGGTGGGGGGTGGGGGITVTQKKPEATIDILTDTPYLTGDHIAYITGYSDGLIHPEANITRGQMAMIMYRLLTPETRIKFKANTTPFTDVSPNDWYATAIATLYNMGIVKGRTGTEYVPEATVTRAEYVTVMTRFTNAVYAGEENFFSDIANNWAARSINLAASLGWVAGSGDGKFHPNENITRAEAITLINRVTKRADIAQDSFTDNMVTFADNLDTKKWYYLPIQEATNGHTYYRDETGHEFWLEIK